jgi:hypothetical protein
VTVTRRLLFVLAASALLGHAAPSDSLTGSAAAAQAVGPDSSAVSEDSAEASDTASGDTTQTGAVAATAKPSAGATDSTEKEDTSYAFWHRPFWGVGLGWTLGSSPIFTAWQQPLPLGAGFLNAVAVTDSHSVIPPGDTTFVRDSVAFVALETPTPYTIYFPVTFSRYFAPDSNTLLSLDLSLFLVYKSLKVTATVYADTHMVLQRTVSQSVGFYTGSIGLRLSRAIPQRYFTMQGVNRASLTAGLSVIPYALLDADYSVQNSGGPVIDTVATLVDAGLAPFKYRWSYTGAGLSWLLGISGITKYGQDRGLEGGLYYSGNWLYFPNLSERSLNPASFSSKAGYSAISHRLAIQFTLLKGKKKKDP